MNKLTIIIPVKNRVKSLMEAINSSSKLDNVSEIIIVDDGSKSPLTKEIINKVYDINKVTIIKNKLAPGAQGARVTGALASSTDVLLFLDSDDILLTGGVCELFSTINANENLALVYGNILFGNNKSNWLQCENMSFPSILRNLSLCPFSGLMVRKSLIPWNELNLALPAWQDDDFCLTVARGRDIKFVDTCVASNRLSNDSISKSKDRQLIGLSMLIEKWKVEILNEFGHRRLFLWRLRQLAVLALVMSSDLKQENGMIGQQSVVLKLLSGLFSIIGRGIKFCLKPFFDRIYA